MVGVFVSLFDGLDINNLFLEYKDKPRKQLQEIFEAFKNYCNEIEDEREQREEIIRTGNEMGTIVPIMRGVLPIEILNHDTYISYWFQCAKVLNEVYNARNA
jgi:hypothetical protein